MVIGKGFTDRYLSKHDFRELTAQALAQPGLELDGKRVLVIIPDHTRTAPIAQIFRLFYELLWGRVQALDYLIAAGTHQPMSQEALDRRVGISSEERETVFAGINVYNHRWDVPGTLKSIGTISSSEMTKLTNGLLKEPVTVTVNRMIENYDQIIICGPVFPHEAVGFSGGNKYFFPGISGSNVINLMHWLSALITNYEIVGRRNPTVRAVIDRAAQFIAVPKLCFSFVVTYQGIAGLYIGTPEESWRAAADLSAKVHIIYLDKPVQQVLSIMPSMYDDLWTAAKGMYKLEPVVADGGEVVIYAPHLDEISFTHGPIIDQVGYHVRDYFISHWEQFKDFPRVVLAHSTVVRGIGTYDPVSDIECPRVQVTLATGIPRERCDRVKLGYLDPNTVDLSEWEGREDEGILVVPKAGEMLYRLKE